MNANQLLSQRVREFVLRNVARDELVLKIVHPIFKLVGLGVGKMEGLDILDVQLRVVIEVLEQSSRLAAPLQFFGGLASSAATSTSVSLSAEIAFRFPLLVTSHFGDVEQEKRTFDFCKSKKSRKEAQDNVFGLFSLLEPPRVSSVSLDVIRSEFPVDPPNLLCSSLKAS